MSDKIKINFTLNFASDASEADTENKVPAYGLYRSLHFGRSWLPCVMEETMLVGKTEKYCLVRFQERQGLNKSMSVRVREKDFKIRRVVDAEVIPVPNNLSYASLDAEIKRMQAESENQRKRSLVHQGTLREGGLN
eukprot:TRINITY_DN10769_c0_g1_i1.p1 TRINITY_DN10769_c0_g1~~TRINITY_DN10769_c0_g1_i1.p1  ORF type:complete len:136 (-),score=12.01 TRINITY_DN10769_c0_g1_i1:11-418(-)